jgi:tRNA(fMet)-specific endonuclease VapC
MSVYLPDTNAVSAYMRGADTALVKQMQARFIDLRLSVIVLAERKFGIVKGASAKYRRQLEALAELLPVVPFTTEDAELYAVIRHDLEAKGTPIGPTDTLIAAQALRLGAVLVTRNVREFRRVKGLVVENWQAE